MGNQDKTSKFLSGSLWLEDSEGCRRRKDLRVGSGLRSREDLSPQTVEIVKKITQKEQRKYHSGHSGST